MPAQQNTLGHSDRPGEHDLLGMDERCKGITEFIRNCETPMTIAINGDWGTGKTTVMQLIRNKLRNQNQQCCVWFNTWQFSVLGAGETLILDLLSMMLDQLDSLLPESDEPKNNPRHMLKKAYALVEGGIRAQMDDSIGMNMVKELSKSIQEAQAESDQKALQNMIASRKTRFVTELMSYMQEKITKILQKLGQDRLYVFIDDLDRLSPKIAVELMEGLKNLADYEGCVFILAVDQEVVDQGLRSKYGADFDKRKAKKFFDKIIQVPFALPVYSYHIQSYLNEFLGKKNAGASAADYEALLKECDVTNPRTIKRCFNLLELYDCIEDAKSERDASYQKMDINRFAVLLLQLESPDNYKDMIRCISAHNQNGNDLFDYQAIYQEFLQLSVTHDPDAEPDGAGDFIDAVLHRFYPDEQAAQEDSYQKMETLVSLMIQTQITMTASENEADDAVKTIQILQSLAASLRHAANLVPTDTMEWDNTIDADARQLAQEKTGIKLIAFIGSMSLYLNWYRANDPQKQKGPYLSLYKIAQPEHAFENVEHAFAPFGSHNRNQYGYEMENQTIRIKNIHSYQKNGSLDAFLQNCGIEIA